jgi:hypothetical protein
MLCGGAISGGWSPVFGKMEPHPLRQARSQPQLRTRGHSENKGGVKA